MANGANPQAVSYAADMSPGNWESVQDIYAQYPNADLDLIQHYVRAGQISDDRGQAAARFGSLAHELNPIGWGVGGISSDDLIAGEGGIQGLNPQQAYDAGLLTHSEGKDWVGLGQGSIGEVLQKAQDAGMFIPGYLNVAAGVPNVIESIKGVGQKAIDLPGEVWGNIKEYTQNAFGGEEAVLDPDIALMSDRVKEALKQPYGSQGELQAITDSAIGAHVGARLRETEKDGLNMYQRYMVGPEYSAPSTPTQDLRDITYQTDSFARMPETPPTLTEPFAPPEYNIGNALKIALDIPPTDFGAPETPVLPREFPMEGWTPGIGDYDQPMGVPPWSFGVPSDLGGLPIVPLTESELESFQREIQMEGAARTSGDYSKAARDTGVYIDRPRDTTKTTDVMPVVPGFDEKGNPITYPQEDSGLTLASYNPALAEELTYATVDPRQVGLDVFDPGRVTAAQENIAGRLERGENVAEITQAMTNPALLTESVRGGAWGKLRDFLISPAQAKNTSIFKSPRVAVEQPEDTTLSDLLKAAKTETGDVAINRLMDLREPRPVRFSDPDDVRRDNAMRLARAPAVLTNEEEMASDVAIALANAKPRPRGMPAPSVTGELQALTELAKTDPSISDRYTTPGSQALQDITTQVESFSEPTVEWTPPTASDRRKDRAIEKAAEASRKAEAKREADTKKKAAEQRAALDSASQRALQNHMAWMATQAATRAEEERLRALRGYGSEGMWT